MYQINVAFFLIGALIFFVIKFMSELKLWGEDPLKTVPKRWAGTIFYLWFGSIFLFASFNILASMIQIAMVSTAPKHVIIYLIPMIILFLHSISFISPSFIKPTINFLLGIMISAIITIVIFLILSFLYPSSFLSIGVGVLPFSFFVASPIGFFSGLIIYVFLKKFLKNYNKDLWDISNKWYIQLFRNDWFEIILIIITFIVAWIYITL
ncbi:MAG: hypothetical protein ACTSPY_01670 [Candidatus Helarchaeota archaeon]